MKPSRLPLFLLLLQILTGTAGARLGETPAEVGDRYGTFQHKRTFYLQKEPVEALIFRRFNLEVEVHLLRGRVEAIIYREVPGLANHVTENLVEHPRLNRSSALVLLFLNRLPEQEWQPLPPFESNCCEFLNQERGGGDFRKAIFRERTGGRAHSATLSIRTRLYLTLEHELGGL